MRLDNQPKLTERQKLSRRRRRTLGASGTVLAVVLMTSWLSLHAWSRDVFPGWLQAVASPTTLLAALGLGADPAEATDLRGRRAAAAPLGRVRQPVATRSREAAVAAQGATLGSAGDASSANVTETRTEVAVGDEVAQAAVAAQPTAPNEPLIDPPDPVAPTPEPPVDAPEQVGTTVDSVGQTVGDVVGDLVPDDFQAALNPRVDVASVGAGVGVGFEVDDSGTDVGVHVDTPVTPVGVTTQVSLENSAGVGAGVRTAVADVGVGVDTSNGISAGAIVPVADVGVSLSDDQGAQVLVDVAPLGVDLGVGLTKGGGLIPEIQIGGLGK